MQDIRKKNMELEDKNKIPDTKAQEETIKQKMQESKECSGKRKEKES